MGLITRRRVAASLGLSLIAPALAAARSDDQQGYTEVPGGRVWWKRVGSGSGTPLLCLHGGPGAGHNYLLPLAALADERPVIFYDQLGCGKSDSSTNPALYTVQRSVEELDILRKALGLNKVVLLGHSWGTMLAIEYVCQGLGLGVEKLILSGAISSIPQFMAGQQRLIAKMPNGEGARIHALEAAGMTNGPEYAALVQTFYDLHVCRRQPLPPDAAASFDILSRSVSYPIMNGPNEFTITGVLRHWDRRSSLGRIHMPTHLTTGEFDEVTLDCHQTIQRAVQNSTLEVFPNCSHLTMNEEPATYVAAIRRLLA